MPGLLSIKGIVLAGLKQARKLICAEEAAATASIRCFAS